jgi:hypothetical protein
MNNIKDENLKKMFSQLLSQPGVMDHGRQPLDIISREKHLSSFQLYVTNTPIEIDCISIRESLAAGCIPLISNFGVFKDREGIHFDLDYEDMKIFKTDLNDNDIKNFQSIAVKILQLLRQEFKIADYRQKIKKSSLLIDWKETAEKWLKQL